MCLRSGYHPIESLDDEQRAVLEDEVCCMGAAHDGAEGCTCWEPTYDVDQLEEDELSGPIFANVRPCHDCAYRPESPERERGDDLPTGASPFWCHQDMRRITHWTHPPTGTVVVAPAGHYNPPRSEAATNVPLTVGGVPPRLCAGWLRTLASDADDPLADVAQQLSPCSVQPDQGAVS